MNYLELEYINTPCISRNSSSDVPSPIAWVSPLPSNPKKFFPIPHSIAFSELLFLSCCALYAALSHCAGYAYHDICGTFTATSIVSLVGLVTDIPEDTVTLWICPSGLSINITSIGQGLRFERGWLLVTVMALRPAVSQCGLHATLSHITLEI